MDLIDKIKAISQTIHKLQDSIQNEQATKTAFIMPFIQALGYDVFNPMEVHPEFKADIAGLKGEKVDYAIIIENQPVILIECKHCHENINQSKHSSQLHRYFHATESKIGILTNGIKYHFFTDTDKPNIMDEKPFFEFDMLNHNESYINELKRFSKSRINQDELLEVARNLLYTKEIKRLLAEQLTNPSPDFVKFFVGQVYSGRMTATVIDKFNEITKQSLKEFINERITDRLKSAMDNGIDVSSPKLPDDNEPKNEAEEETIEDDGIVTTEEELEGFYIVKSILREVINTARIQYKDTKSYFGINLDGKVTKTICRLRFTETKKTIGVLNSEGKEAKKEIANLDEIYGVASMLIARLNFLTKDEAKSDVPKNEILDSQE
jgi:hypothetical protein